MKVIADNPHISKPGHHGVMVYNRTTGDCIITIKGKPARREQGFLSTVEKLKKEGWRVFEDDTSRYYGEVCQLFRGEDIPNVPAERDDA